MFIDERLTDVATPDFQVGEGYAASFGGHLPMQAQVTLARYFQMPRDETVERRVGQRVVRVRIPCRRVRGLAVVVASGSLALGENNACCRLSNQRSMSVRRVKVCQAGARVGRYKS